MRRILIITLFLFINVIFLNVKSYTNSTFKYSNNFINKNYKLIPSYYSSFNDTIWKLNKNDFELYENAYKIIRDTNIVSDNFSKYFKFEDSLSICVSTRIYNKIEAILFANDIIKIEYPYLNDSCKRIKKEEFILNEYKQEEQTRKYCVYKELGCLNEFNNRCDLIIFFEKLRGNKFRADLIIYNNDKKNDYYESIVRSSGFMEFLFYYENNTISNVLIKQFVR